MQTSNFSNPITNECFSCIYVLFYRDKLQDITLEKWAVSAKSLWTLSALCRLCLINIPTPPQNNIGLWKIYTQQTRQIYLQITLMDVSVKLNIVLRWERVVTLRCRLETYYCHEKCFIEWVFQGLLAEMGYFTYYLPFKQVSFVALRYENVCFRILKLGFHLFATVSDLFPA